MLRENVVQVSGLHCNLVAAFGSRSCGVQTKMCHQRANNGSRGNRTSPASAQKFKIGWLCLIIVASMSRMATVPKAKPLHADHRMFKKNNENKSKEITDPTLLRGPNQNECTRAVQAERMRSSGWRSWCCGMMHGIRASDRIQEIAIFRPRVPAEGSAAEQSLAAFPRCEPQASARCG